MQQLSIVGKDYHTEEHLTEEHLIRMLSGVRRRRRPALAPRRFTFHEEAWYEYEHRDQPGRLSQHDKYVGYYRLPVAAIAEQKTLPLIFQEKRAHQVDQGTARRYLQGKPRELLSNVVPEEAMETFPEDAPDSSRNVCVQAREGT